MAEKVDLTVTARVDTAPTMATGLHVQNPNSWPYRSPSHAVGFVFDNVATIKHVWYVLRLPYEREHERVGLSASVRGHSCVVHCRDEVAQLPR